MVVAPHKALVLDNCGTVGGLQQVPPTTGSVFPVTRHRRGTHLHQYWRCDRAISDSAVFGVLCPSRRADSRSWNPGRTISCAVADWCFAPTNIGMNHRWMPPALGDGVRSCGRPASVLRLDSWNR